MSNELIKEVDDNLKKVEKIMGMKFGDPKNPLFSQFVPAHGNPCLV